MLTEKNMITLCRRAEEIAMGHRFKAIAIHIATYRFDDELAGESEVISLFAKNSEEENDVFSQSINSSTTLPEVADAIIREFEGYMSAEG